MGRSRERVLLVGASVTLTLALLEFGLRAAGQVFFWRQEAAARAAQSGRPTILCIGESTTALGGQGAYPAQLEEVLHEQGRDVAVVNQGIPGTTTDAIIEKLPGWIEEYHPRVIVAMMGVNDPSDVDPQTWVPQVIRSLRLYKLAAYVADGLARRFGEKAVQDMSPSSPVEARAQQLFEAGQLDAARAAIEPELAARPNDVFARLLLARILLGLHHTAGGDALLAAVADEAPGDVHRQTTVAWYYLFAAEYEQARAVLGRALAARRTPQVERLLEGTYYAEVDSLTRTGRLDEAAEALHRAEPYVKQPDLFHRRLALLAKARGDQPTFRREFEEMARLAAKAPHTRTERSFAALHAIARASAVRLIAVQYPLRDVAPLEDMLDHDPDVVFVDNEQSFRDAVTGGSWETYFWDVFAGDFGHLTATGNRLLAENIARGMAIALRDDGASAKR